MADGILASIYIIWKMYFRELYFWYFSITLTLIFINNKSVTRRVFYKMANNSIIEFSDNIKNSLDFRALTDQIIYLAVLYLTFERQVARLPFLETSRNILLFIGIMTMFYTHQHYNMKDEPDAEKCLKKKTTVSIKFIAVFATLLVFPVTFTLSYFPEESPLMPQLIFMTIFVSISEIVNCVMFFKLSPEKKVSRDFLQFTFLQMINYIGWMVSTFAPFFFDFPMIFSDYNKHLLDTPTPLNNYPGLHVFITLGAFSMLILIFNILYVLHTFFMKSKISHNIHKV